MMDGPGTGCAFVMCDQLAILCTPLEYCNATVLPVIISFKFPQFKPGPFGIHTDIGKFAVLEDDKVVLDAEFLEFLNEDGFEVFNDIDMCLHCGT